MLSFKYTPFYIDDFLIIKSMKTSKYIEVDNHRLDSINMETLAMEFERVLGSLDEISTIRYTID